MIFAGTKIRRGSQVVRQQFAKLLHGSSILPHASSKITPQYCGVILLEA